MSYLIKLKIKRMEINMNGSISINLDKMRGPEIKKYISALVVAYLLVIGVTLCLP